MTGIVKCGRNLSQTCKDVDLPDGPFERSCCPNTGVVCGRNRRSCVSRGDLRIRTPDGSYYMTNSGEASTTTQFIDNLARKRERGTLDFRTLARRVLRRVLRRRAYANHVRLPRLLWKQAATMQHLCSVGVDAAAPRLQLVLVARLPGGLQTTPISLIMYHHSNNHMVSKNNAKQPLQHYSYRLR